MQGFDSLALPPLRLSEACVMRATWIGSAPAPSAMLMKADRVSQWRADSGRREALLNRASFDLGCEKSKLNAVELNSTYGPYSIEFGVTGCEKKATYVVSVDGVNGYAVRQDGEQSKK